MRRVVLLPVKICLFISCIIPLVLGSGCTSLDKSIIKDPNVRGLKEYKELHVSKWKKCGISVQDGEAVVITPLYPRGFIYSVKAKIGIDGEVFDTLDVDVGEIHRATKSGTLFIGIDAKTYPVKAGVFIFRSYDVDTIRSDLSYLFTKNPKSKILSLTLGSLHLQHGQALVAAASNHEALKVLDKALYHFTTLDSKTYAVTISRIYKLQAAAYKSLGNLAKFDKNVDLSLEALMKVSKYYSNLETRRYSFLQVMTQEERFLLLTKTLFVQKSTADSQWKKEWGFDFRNLSVAYAYLGKYYSDMGNLQLSLRYCMRAIEEAEKSGNRNLLGFAYGYLGLRHLKFRFLDSAEEAFLKSLSYSSTLHASNMADQLLLVVRGMKGEDFDEIEKGFQRLLKKYSKFTIVPRYIKLGLGDFYTNRGEYEKAIPVLMDVYGSFKNDRFNKYYGNRFREQYILFGLVRCYTATGRFKEAAHYLDILESDLEALGNPHRLRLFLNLYKAEVMRKTGGDPVEPLLEAVASLEVIRPTATGSSADYKYWENKLAIYDNSVEVLYERGDILKALEVAEKSRSRKFLDYLGGKRLGVKGDKDYMLTENATYILESLSVLENDMLDAAQKSGIKVRNVYQEGTRYSHRVQAYTNNLKESSRVDRQFGLIYNVIPLTPDVISKNIPDEVQIIEYYLSKNTLYIWIIDNKNIYGIKQKVPNNNLQDLIIAFRKSISVAAAKRGITVTKKTSTNMEEIQQELYKILISPVEEYLDSKKIGIVPYGILNYLPFQALHDGEQYLLEKYSVSYIPSLSVLEFITKKESKKTPAIIAFGNPDLGDRKFDLPAAEKEVNTIRGLFPNTLVLKRRTANEASAKSMIREYDIIHFACHGEYVAEAPLASCIHLAPGNGEDGRLSADEIFDMDIHADLVVTSACQTGIGSIGKGDEIVGLTRAFIYAGANSVFASLWSISDEATAILMRDFYSNIRSHDKAEALRKAQLKMLRSDKYSNPFYWAAFNLTGGI